MNDWPTIPDLVFGNGNNLSGWLIDLGFVLPDGIDIFSTNNQAFFGSIIWSTEAKANKSMYVYIRTIPLYTNVDIPSILLSDTSITDPWSRMISYHFLNQTTRNNFFTNDTAHGAGQLWSQVPETSLYQQFVVPFPIIYADSRPVGSNATGFLSLDSTVYEVSWPLTP
jgi:lysophospholipase